MKVCIFNLSIYKLFDDLVNAPIGGTEVQLFNLANYLRKFNRYKLSIVTGDYGQKSKTYYKNITIYKSINLSKNILNYFLAPFRIIRSIAQANSDIYIASSAGAEIGIISLFCLVFRRKFIYRVAHDNDCNGIYENGNGLFGKFFLFGLKNANIIITQTSDQKKLLIFKYGLTSYTIKNAYLIPKTKHCIKNNILWVSRCEKWKNPFLVFKLSKKFPKLNFTMICPKQLNHLDYFTKIKKKAKLISNIDFIDYVSFSKIQQYYDKSRIFIGTSDYEGFPNTYLQSCIGKTPIVSYKVNPDNFITKNKLGYCANGNIIKMSKMINKLMKNNILWKKKSHNAYRYIKNNHNIKKIGITWRKIFDGLIN